jgi:enoyl-CoA hydratase/carnithine racemase
MIALAADMRLGTPSAKTAYLFTRVGLAGADMGACGLLPRVIGQGRATELLMTGGGIRTPRLVKSWLEALGPEVPESTCGFPQ